MNSTIASGLSREILVRIERKSRLPGLKNSVSTTSSPFFLTASVKFCTAVWPQSFWIATTAYFFSLFSSSHLAMNGDSIAIVVMLRNCQSLIFRKSGCDAVCDSCGTFCWA